MTIVEFFDKDAIENVVSSLLCNPESVVLIGDDYDVMINAAEKYKTVVEKHGVTVNFSVVSVSKNELEKIVENLEQLVKRYGKIAIDLTGGEDLYLVAAGIVYQNNPDKVYLHRFNLDNGTLYDCDTDGNVIKTTRCDISIEDNLSIYGGRIICKSTQEKKAEIKKWDFDNEFKSDIDKMWKISSKNAKNWNRIMTKCFPEDVEDDTNLRVIANAFDPQKERIIITRLEQQCLIKNVRIIYDKLYFTCKNLQIKRCLTSAGQLLEVKTATTLMKINDTNEGKAFNDILTGVTIHWDLPKDKKAKLTNEIDVLIIKDLIPCFISCKNGSIDVEELYKLSTVAERFGGKYAKKILVASENWGSVAQRAKEMDIHIIDDVKGCEDFTKDLETILKA